MKEEVVQFGRTRSLVGVVTESNLGDRARDRLGILFLNAGIIHRIGPNRLYVNLARRLAASGCVALRFDFSGIGDSRVRSDGLAFQQSTVEETQAAMDWLAATHGCREFVLIGLCSGADIALRVANADDRVVGAVLIDGFAYPTFGSFVRSRLGRLWSPRTWVSLVSGRSDVWLIARKLVEVRVRPRSDPQPETWQMPSREDMVAGLRGAADRGVQLYLIYSGGSPSYYNYRRWLAADVGALAAEGCVQVELFTDADHTFTALDDQKQLVDVTDAWVRATASAGTVSPRRRRVG